MAMGQNDDIEPATATGRVAAASRACRAARMALRLASVTRLAQPGGLQAGPAGRERVRDDHLGAGPDELLVDVLHHVGLIQVRAGAPRDLVHRHALSLQLTAHAAVDDHQLAIGDPPENDLGHAHIRPLSSQVRRPQPHSTAPRKSARQQPPSPAPGARAQGARVHWLCRGGGRPAAPNGEPGPAQAYQAGGGRWPGRRAGMGSRNSSRFPFGSWL